MRMARTNQGQGMVLRILEEVSAIERVDPLELPPLGETVDTDALETLLDSETHVAVTFEYAGHRVHADSDGTLTVG